MVGALLAVGRSFRTIVGSNGHALEWFGDLYRLADGNHRFRRSAAPAHNVSNSASQSSEIGRVIYANSITLTPGTVSVTVDETTIAVHALTQEAAEGVENGEMDGRGTHLEGSH